MKATASDETDEDRVWKALGDRTRRRLLDELRDGPRTTGDLCASSDGLCRTAVMKHVDILVDAGLIVAERRGRFRWNHLNPVPIQQICERWLTRHAQSRAAAALRLKRLAESGG